MQVCAGMCSLLVINSIFILISRSGLGADCFRYASQALSFVYVWVWGFVMALYDIGREGCPVPRLRILSFMRVSFSLVDLVGRSLG